MKEHGTTSSPWLGQTLQNVYTKGPLNRAEAILSTKKKLKYSDGAIDNKE